MMKKKVVLWALLSGIGLMLGSALSLLLSSVIHIQLSRGELDAADIALPRMLDSVMADRRHRLLFACIMAVLVLLAVLLVLTNKRGHYESDLRTVTPKIKTPVPAGQSQHGSARWLEKSRFRKVFAMESIDFNHPVIKELMEHGYDPAEKGKEIKPHKPVVKKVKKKKPKIRPTRQLSIVSEGWSGDWIKQ